ncbi:MAG TPA: TonB family protein [Blastocatellia bacterium]|nr:TonB family protein [Blastocatellia bacterium]HMV85547.1 TonB family protein [Blastocatellia bacterium]HMX29917.1 TonB family protein [Blastocatellia bacterium]HMY73121.1 TonB family protein [Blastocatellia bacterium]HMZ17851.1 TonB family protein [Blastocatellia bacterium]
MTLAVVPSVAFLVLSSFFVGLGFTQSTQPTVVRAVAPKYPPLARVTNAQGTVIVSVKINNQGNVVSASAIEGHVLLRKAAEAAAIEWQFDSSGTLAENRETQVIFSFSLKLEESANVRDETEFIFPNRYSYVYKIPTVQPISRVAGQIEEKHCSLHDEKMELGLAEIVYGLPESEIGYPNDVVHFGANLMKKIKKRNSYFNVAQRSFPNSYLWVGGGCEVGVEKKAEILFCRHCRNAELQWSRKHPGKGYGVVAVISGGKN